jgi:hypothetical protein
MLWRAPSSATPSPLMPAPETFASRVLKGKLPVGDAIANVLRLRRVYIAEQCGDGLASSRCLGLSKSNRLN